MHGRGRGVGVGGMPSGARGGGCTPYWSSAWRARGGHCSADGDQHRPSSHAEEHRRAQALVDVHALARRLAPDRSRVLVVLERRGEALEVVVQPGFVIGVVLVPDEVELLEIRGARLGTDRRPAPTHVPLAVEHGVAHVVRDVIALARRLAPLEPGVAVEDVLVVEIGPVHAAVANLPELLRGLQVLELGRLALLDDARRLPDPRARVGTRLGQDAGASAGAGGGLGGRPRARAEARASIREGVDPEGGEARVRERGHRATGDHARAADRLPHPRGRGGGGPLREEGLRLFLDGVHRRLKREEGAENRAGTWVQRGGVSVFSSRKPAGTRASARRASENPDGDNVAARGIRTMTMHSRGRRRDAALGRACARR